MDFLEIRCRCKQKNTPLECRSLLGGPSIDTVLNHDFSSAPFIDIRYCPGCKRMMKITITDLTTIPVIEALPKQYRLNFKKIEDLFKFVEVIR